MNKIIRFVLLAKALGDFKHSGKYYLHNGRWHKIHKDKPAPKSAPIAAHPHAAGQHEPVKHFTDEQWSQLKLPAENVNAGSYNKHLDKLKEMSEAGHVTGILGMQFGINTYGKKAAHVANKLLEMHGTQHKVTPGQKAGEHPAVNAEPAEQAPSKDEAIQAAVDHLKEDAKQGDLPASEQAEDKALIGKLEAAQSAFGEPEKKPELKGSVQAPVSAFAEPAKPAFIMPEFIEGKDTNGKVVEYYEKMAHKVMDIADSGGLAALEQFKAETSVKKNGKPSLTWGGKTGNSKLLIGLYDKAVQHAQSKAPADQPAPVAPANQNNDPKDGDTKEGADGTLTFKNGRWHKIGKPAENPKQVVGDAIKQKLKNDEALTQKLESAGFKVHFDEDGQAFLAFDLPGLPKRKFGNLDKAHTTLDKLKALGLKAFWVAGGHIAVSDPAADAVANPESPAQPKAPEAKAASAPIGNATSKVDMIPWDSQLLPDSNANAKSHNKQVGKIKALAEAGDLAGLEALKFGVNTYGKKQEKLKQLAIAALKESAPAPAQAPAPAPAAETVAINSTALSGDELVNVDDYLLLTEAGQKKIDATDYAALAGDIAKVKTLAGLYEAEGGPHNSSTAHAKETLRKMQAKADAVAAPAPSATASLPAKPKLKDFNNNLVVTTWHKMLADGKLKETSDSVYKLADAIKANSTLQHDDDALGLLKHGLDLVKWINGKGANSAPKAPVKPVFTSGPGLTWNSSIKALEIYANEGNWEPIKSFASSEMGSEEGKVAKKYANDLLAYHGQSATPEDGPKDGDTKEGADGTLVFKNGRWHKVVNADEHGELPPVLVPVDDGQPSAPVYKKLAPKHAISLGKNIKTAAGNKAKLKAMAVAGDADALKDFIDNSPKFPASVQYAKNLLAAMSAGGTAEPASQPKASKPKAAKPAASVEAKHANVEKIDSWEQTGGQGGSNPGGKFKDEHGVEWYCKFPGDEDVAKSEVLAAKLYQIAGIAGQDAKLITKGGKLGIASRWTDVTKVSPGALANTDGVQSGFAVDAWLANWDVVGLGYDNLQVGADGKAIRIDAGGSLQYRAQGGKKAFGASVTEIDSLRDPKINAQAAAVFGSMTKADITASVKKVASISDDDIYDAVMEHGPGTLEDKANLIDTLIARKTDLLEKFPKAVKKEPAKKKQDPTALKVDVNQLPPTHDFKNWNGEGKGLSSKEHVNDMNLKAEQDLLTFAAKGNLIALKDYHFEAIDKESGQSQGMKPINEHPSKHVKLFWSDLVSTLGYIANPPEALKKFKSVVAASVTKVSDAFKSAKYGTTTDKVDANSRLAFWIALGHTKPAESLLPPGSSLEFQSDPKRPKITMDMVKVAKQAYSALNYARPVKKFINGIQASGSYNDNFRDGRMITNDGEDAVNMVIDAYDYATEKPEGFEIYKWINFGGGMDKQLLATPPGTVFQNPGSMCCSHGANTTKGFGNHRMRIRYAKGAKAVDSFGSGTFEDSEREITTLPGQRFVILSCKKVMCPAKGKERIELDVLMLPPDPSYVNELHASKGNHGKVAA